MKWAILFAALLFSGSAFSAALKVQDKQIARTTPRVEMSVAYPQTGNAAIDTMIVAWVKQNTDDFQGDDADESRSPWTLDIRYEVVRNDGKLFSVQFDIDDYSGGAHPNHAFGTFNFLLPEGAPVDIEQVIDGRKGLARLSALTVADLKRQMLPEGGSESQWIDRGAGPDWSNFENFLLLPHSLRIEFAPYAVGPYSSGPQEVEIPLSELAGALSQNLRAPVPSFDCSKASSVIEHAICASTTLSGLDRQVARAYRRASATTDDGHNAAVKQAQRAWLSQRNATCGQLQPEALNGCLTKIYQARLAGIGNAQ